ncbi:hypothetical protein UFOVP785_102 [uncultured Caudovirales phage]|uniref:Uncharacterized protein n=1 Tax=uncultured Caudovirales phage TaxID=2100421 RepID=A0A6J5P5D8_9CAUD|nr:hypothetical protein UFOVP785_102 [uncultured Caudovirales phage]
MKKAVTKKPPGKKPEVKQVEKFNWELRDSDDCYIASWDGLTEEDALAEAEHFATTEAREYELCKMVPVYRFNTIPPSKPQTTVTCLATGETTTITL